MADKENKGSIWTARKVLQRAITVFSEKGLKSLWFAIVGETCYRRLLLFRLNAVDKAFSVHPEFAGLSFTSLSPADKERYLYFRSSDTATQSVCDMRYRCMLASIGNELVGNCWIAKETAPINYLNLALELNPGQVYLFDTFTAPIHRGKTIAPSLVSYIIEECARSGCSDIWAAVLPENTGGQRLFFQLGFVHIGVVGYLKFGRWKHNFCRFFDGAHSADSYPRLSQP